ncbi:pyridoxal phosphate-dependent aminotransferase [Roseateles sp. DAIF2]|uniref:pyridoxal phosphate-dependent aminotransferase n=1 Tax=Roseateles sp. DAIF2 TaxID=2714952 RepID=UPI0018A2C9C8|nr:pyridoxal phosphate-dependent aminotransferase [Roseateles sp. DAIF2]QPF74290.1 pyridoxal phosphate-dependent aminotransferase [Roseateles sp. DAIF2]
MRELITQLPASKIREVANAGIGREDVLAFWFGESDEVTPQPVREAAAASLARGETFYSHNLGLPELREALAGYVAGLHPAVGPGRIAVTSSGVSALMIALQALVSPGDEVVAVVPLWPNLTAQAQILGARVRRVSLAVEQGAGWGLDLQALLDAITPATRVLLLNAPNNPTGWTLSRAEQLALLEHCRRTGTWIVADEVYERLYYVEGERAAPSFLDLAAPQDRVIVVHSFSKSFLMTGWRLGWLVLPEGLADGVAKLIEFNTSCAPVFVQRGGLAAVRMAADFVPQLVARMKTCRNTLLPALAALPAVRVREPLGGMYAFFRLEGVPGGDDSLALAKRLVREAGLGLAPGAAFGDEGEGWLRWCFASRDPQRLRDGVARLAGAIGL